jgi:hypothetical protein
MNDQTGGLVDHDQVLVLEQDRHVDRLRDRARRRGRRHLDLDHVAGAQAHPRPGGPAVHPDLAVVDQPSQLRARQPALAERGDQEVIEAGAGRVGHEPVTRRPAQWVTRSST